MPQAVYQPGNIGHFGRARTLCATSPIRRYPDLVVHRGVRLVIEERDAQELVEAQGPLPVLGQDCSFRERRAGEATRAAIAWLKCYYMERHLGEEFDGIISGSSISACSCRSRACRSTVSCTFRRSARTISRATSQDIAWWGVTPDVCSARRSRARAGDQRVAR